MTTTTQPATLPDIDSWQSKSGAFFWWCPDHGWGGTRQTEEEAIASVVGHVQHHHRERTAA